MGLRQLIAAKRRNDENRHLFRSRRDELDEIHGRAAGPMEIFEYSHERARVRELTQTRANRLEEPKASGTIVGECYAGLLVEQPRRVPKRVHERFVRPVLSARRRMSSHDDAAFSFGQPRKLGGQSAFAATGLAADKQNAGDRKS